MPNLFDACTPRAEVLEGELTEAQFAARLQDVYDGNAAPAYQDPTRFFATTHPSEGLRSLLNAALGRLTGTDPTAAPVIRLETSYGGGKTHNLIALYHAARGGLDPAEAPTFMDPTRRPVSPFGRIAVFVGTDQGAASLPSRHGVSPQTIWGDMALQLGGAEAYSEIASDDQQRLAPGATVLKRIFGDQPTLLLLDELPRYLVVARGVKVGDGSLADQVVAFLMSLLEAASSSPRTVVVFTLSTGADAFGSATQELAEKLNQARSVAARSEVTITAAGETDLAAILARRLFERVDLAAAKAAASEYSQALQVAASRGADVPQSALGAEFTQTLQRSYPFHPTMVRVLDAKLSTIPNFQRTRGALRLLALVLRSVWQTRESGTRLLHLHHVDLRQSEIAEELTSRLDRPGFRSVIRADIVSDVPGMEAHAQALDNARVGQPPYSRRVATTIFLNSLTNDIPGVGLAELMLATLTPDDEPAVVGKALELLQKEAWYLDEAAPGYRFRTEASLNKLIADAMTQIPTTAAKKAATDQLENLFKKGTFAPVLTWTGEQPKDAGRPPQLVVLHYDELEVGPANEVPAKVQDMWTKTPTGGPREYRNALVFLCPAGTGVEPMLDAGRRFLALEKLAASPEQLGSLSAADRTRLTNMHKEQGLLFRVAVCNAYSKLFVPADGNLDLLELPTVTTATPAVNHTEQVVKALDSDGRLITAASAAPDPGYVRQKAWPHGAKVMPTSDVIEAYARRPGMKIVLDQAKLIESIAQGVRSGVWEYREGDRCWTKDGAPMQVRIEPTTELCEVGTCVTVELCPNGCGKPKHDGPCEVLCPFCGKPAHKGPCEDRRLTFTADAATKVAMVDVRQQALDAGAAAVAEMRVEVRASAPALREQLARLLATVAADNAAIALALQITGVAVGESTLSSTFRGDLKAFEPLRSGLEGFLKAAGSGQLDVTTTRRFDPPVAVSGSELDALISRAGDVGPDKAIVTLTAAPPEAENVAP